MPPARAAADPTAAQSTIGVGVDEVVAYLADARSSYGSYWRKLGRASEPGAEHELAQIALELEKLDLVARSDDRVLPLPALSRFSIAEAEIRAPGDVAAIVIV